MKTILIRSGSIIIAISLALLPANDCLAALDKSKYISASGVKPFNPNAILDTFTYAAPINNWNVRTSTYDSTNSETDPAVASCVPGYVDTTGTESSGKCLRLVYDVNNLKAWSAYVSQLCPPDLALPGGSLTAYNAVSFYVKGSVGRELFKVQIANKSADNIHNAPASYPGAGDATTYSRNISSVYVNDLLDGGITTSWKKVTIPFKNFANLDGWSSMKEFAIVFDNGANAASGSPKTGTVYIDDIKFETVTLPNIRLDHFGDKYPVCSLGGNMQMGVGDGASSTLNNFGFSSTTNEFSPYANGLKINYSVASRDSYSYLYSIFGGGNTTAASTKPLRAGWIPVPQDFSSYTYLSIKVRALSTTTNPEKIKIELKDSAGSRAMMISGITTSWNTFRMPLAGFMNIDTGAFLNKAAIQQITIVFENSQAVDKTGTIFIDSIQFE